MMTPRQACLGGASSLYPTHGYPQFVLADLLAISAILLWSSLAALSASLTDLPPLFITGVALLIGSLISIPVAGFRLRTLLPTPRLLLMGVYGLLGYHVLLFLAFRFAPPLAANLINYLWPLAIVLLAPLIAGAGKLTLRQIVAALVGFSGAALVVFSRESTDTDVQYPLIWLGYLLAFGAALVWSTYSLLTSRVTSFPTANVGAFAAVSGLIALGLHLLFEPPVNPTAEQWLLILLLGVGPLGGAFYLWDAALKRGNPQRIGLFAFATPLLSTAFLLVTTSQPLTLDLAFATALIVGAAWLGTRVSRKRKTDAA